MPIRILTTPSIAAIEKQSDVEGMPSSASTGNMLFEKRPARPKTSEPLNSITGVKTG
jgi:hypothetical protein